MSDERRIEKELMSAFEMDPHINPHRDRLKVEAGNGAIVLSGEVSDVAAKRAAVRIAVHHPGVRTIEDRVRVAVASAMTDGEIRDHVRDALLGESAFADYNLSVVQRGGRVQALRDLDRPAGELALAVQEGAVTLEGRVASLTHRRLAGALAWWVPGVVNVDNRLLDMPHGGDNDGELAEAVRVVLEKDHLLDASQITVDSGAFEVTLSGVVPSKEQRNLAEHDVWFVDGVREVRNQLTVP